MRAALLAGILTLAAAAPAAAQDPEPTPTPAPTVTPAPAPEPTIAPGITVAGVDLSGMTLAEARQALKPVRRTAHKKVQVKVAGKRFNLKARKARVRFKLGRTARRAYERGVDAPPAAGDTVAVKPVIRFERDAVEAWTDKIARRVYRAPRDAAVRIAVTRIRKSPGRPGAVLREKKASWLVRRALRDPQQRRTIKPGRKWRKPDVRTRDLRRRYPAIITIDQSSFTLRLFRNLRYDRRYGVAVGLPAYPTPNGLFAIQSKQVNPTWTAPNSPWAGEMAGQSISGGDPSNPLKARWMGVNGAVGIHGTGQEYSIGSRASHGCIRMRVADVIDLFDRVSVGTPVLIAP